MMLRFKIVPVNAVVDLRQDDFGEWVRYTDAQEIINALHKEVAALLKEKSAGLHLRLVRQ